MYSKYRFLKHLFLYLDNHLLNFEVIKKIINHYMKRFLLFLSISMFYTFTVKGQCTVAIEQSGPNCYMMCAGWANAIPDNGVPPYSYHWSNQVNMQSLTELCSGTYSVTVTDSLGCIAINSITILDAPMLYLTVDSVHNASCFGLADGEAWIHAVGGIPPYTYDWNNGNDSTYISGLMAVEYYPIVTDSIGCTYGGFVNITSPPQIVFNEMLTPPYCFNNTGFIQPYVSGGTPFSLFPYQYQWSTFTNPNFATTENIYSLGPDLYTLSVTDSLGCTNVEVFKLNTSDGPNPTVSWLNVSCNGLNNGMVTNVTHTVPTNAYYWSTGATTLLPYPQNLAPGNYWYKETTPAGCNGFDYFTVTEPNPITNIPFQLDLNCFGDSTGYISLDIQGGSPSQTYPYYDFLWSTGDTTNFVDQVPSGTYSVTVTDIQGCTYTNSYNIISPSIFLIDSIHLTNITCNGFNDGSVGIFASGGVPPYYFSIDSIYWNHYDTITSLLPNVTYHIVAKDSNYCYTYSSYFSFIEPPLIDITYNQIDPTCIGNNGSIDITPTGGVIPFSITWDTPGMTSFTETGLSQGLYDATVTDANGCVNQLFFVMNQTSSPAVLSGSISYSGGALPPNEAKIFLFTPSTTGAVEMDTIAATTNSTSIWQFSGLLPGNYYVKANLLNPLSFPNVLNSYYDNTFEWLNATPIVLSCDDTTNITLNMASITPQTTGNGTISGTVIMIGGTKAAGEPVPGAEILIEQEPNDVPVQCVFTDSTGLYVFHNLVPDTGYHIIVQIPGFPQINTYQNITVIANDTLPNLNFLVDTIVGIYKDTASFVSQISINGVGLEVYPNPFVTNINVKLSLTKSANVSYELYDELGHTIIKSKPVFMLEGKNEFNIVPNNNTGICYLMIKAGETILVKKLISNKK